MQAAEVRERIAQMDIESVGSTPAQCDAFLRAQIETWIGKNWEKIGTHTISWLRR
jgi:tripartite-type tricarboxylate transporter receptor subunit TctC